MIQDNILAGLNERQLEAVKATTGPVLVIAGPGSGKTKALTHHIAYLMATGMSPSNILAVTFTNKAAGEMRARVYKLLSLQVDKASGVHQENLQTYKPRNLQTYRGPFIGTFHSFAAYILRKEAGNIGYRPNFSIYDEDDSLGLIKEILKERNIGAKNFPAPMVASVISNLKNDLISADEYNEAGQVDSFGRTIAQVYDDYARRLRLANALDFDDLIFWAVRLFGKRRDTLERWQNRFRFIHVDEYQDTSLGQYELMRLLAAKHRNLFVIGDDAQSIYAWRRADYRNITNFERDWPEAKIILLEENYRSTPEIISAANQLIAKNKAQKPKTLWTKNDPGGLPQVTTGDNEKAEAEFVAGEIKAAKGGETDWRDIAVLYRTNAQSRALEEAMIENEVPYVIIGGIRFWQRREVKDIMAYLRLVQNPGDHIAKKRIINVPARGIGPKTFLSYLGGKTGELNERDRIKIEKFEAIMTKLRQSFEGATLADFLRTLIKMVGYEDYIRDFSPDGESRVENVREFVSVARKYDALPADEAATKLLEEVALASEQDQLKNDDNRVKLMTIHAAKGLEFHTVFVTGLEEGILPHAKSIQSGGADLEEERRLCYVAMTRAKKKLYLTWALARTIFGEIQVNMPSRFLFEMPEEMIGQEMRELDDIYLVNDND